MGGIEDRLKTIDQGQDVKSPPLKSELEKALEEEEAELAREMRIGRAEETIAKRQYRINQLRQQLGRGGAAMTEEERAEQEKRKAAEELKEKAERIEQAKALYTSCIDAGGDPKRCADMVAGLIPTPTATAVAPPATSITELISALKTLDELRGSDKGLAALKTSFDNLAEQIRQGNANKQQPLDPIAFAKQQAEAVAAWHKAINEITPSPVNTTGEPLENVKEEHRHDEKMEELHADRQYKEDLTTIAGEIPERIGRGLAGQIVEGEKSNGGGRGGSLNYFTCTEKGCGAKIYVTPETNTVTCPKCGSIYTPQETVETKEE